MEGEAEMTEQEEFEFRLRFEREQGNKPVASIPAVQSDTKTPAQKATQSVAIGLAEPFVGLTQRLGEGRKAISAAFPLMSTLAATFKPGADAVANKFNELDKAGETYALPKFAGNVLSGFAFGGNAPLASSLTGKAMQGGVLGAIGGATQPTLDPEQANSNALMGFGIGAGLPLVLSAAGSVVKGAYNKLVLPTSNLFRGAKGERNVLRSYLGSMVGEDNVPATINAARTAGAEKFGPEIYPVDGFKPTIAQVMQGVPEGSPLVALQDITARTYGGPSATFGNRTASNINALTAASAERNAVAAPAREAALDAAKGGVNLNKVSENINNFASKEGYRASDVVTKSLAEIGGKLDKLAPDGVISPRDLYTVRKEIGSTIEKFSKETANWDKSLTAKIERELQLAIDDAIEKAGGVGWKSYLREYAGRSKAIDFAREGMEQMYLPTQKTTIGGGLNIGDETRAHVPNLLSRTAMLGNYVLRHLGKRMEPGIDKLAAEVFTNPEAYAKMMSETAPELRFTMDKALRSSNALAFGAGASQ